MITPQTCGQAIRLVAQVHRVAVSDAESPQALLDVPVPLIPYVEQIRALRRELARERAARTAMQAALARMVHQLERALGRKAVGTGGPSSSAHSPPPTAHSPTQVP